MRMTSVWQRLFPRSLDNTFDGYRVALWLFGFVTLIRAVQSVAIIFNGWDTIINADGIPLESYPSGAAQNIIALFAIVSVWRLIFCLAGLVVLVRYRSAVPIMFVLHMLSYLGAVLSSEFVPLMRVGSPPGPLVNLGQFVVMSVGLVLSLIPRRDTLQ
ncbi:MAG TPA: hypothetical protein VEV84_09035 [Pyrinomonadaceae bacterium]|jgi:hypothetical protein|nr:hypothetical protein [Pyrinomonadaceae bacterium]